MPCGEVSFTTGSVLSDAFILGLQEKNKKKKKERSKSCCCNYSENSIPEWHRCTKSLQVQSGDIFQKEFSKKWAESQNRTSSFQLRVLNTKFSSATTFTTCNIGELIQPLEISV